MDIMASMATIRSCAPFAMLQNPTPKSFSQMWNNNNKNTMESHIFLVPRI